ncbi:MAG: zinc-dependent alcohol dehydrogenase family protein [Alphaproteobacteria bacterium]|nr:zinc-dependent alcohol dehydrogenase family protein [Alphaproteobacteria bacterium]
MVRDRIVRLYEVGGPEVLRLEAVPPEAPRAGEVRLRVHAIGLNNSEAQYRRGEYPLRDTTFPTRLGRECSGIVEALGEGVTSVSVGDVVSTIPAFDIQRGGVYGEWAVVPAGVLVSVPDGLSHLEAAAAWQQYLTAYGPLIEHSTLRPGDTVLITAASSSVGRGAIQMARLLGCRVIAATRNPAKRDLLLASGAHHVVVTDEEDLASRVSAITDGKGFRVALDPIAGPGLRTLAEAAGHQATIFEYGQLSRDPAPFPLLDVLRKSLSIRGYTLWEITLDAARRRRAVDFISGHLARGTLRPAIDRVFRLDDIVEAHRYIESGRQTGKIVIDVAGDSDGERQPRSP